MLPLLKGIFKSYSTYASNDRLKDSNDDVRAVSSSSLLPITSLLSTLLPPQTLFSSLFLTLWDSLHDLDDLTAATTSVMDLLSDLIKMPLIAEILKKEAAGFLDKLVPQLFPFFRHASTSVRLAVLRTISTLASLAKTNCQVGVGGASWITTDLLRLVFQNFVLEEKREVVDLSLSVWSDLLGVLELDDSGLVLDALAYPTLSILFALGLSPIGAAPLDHRLLISYQQDKDSQPRKKGANNVQGLNIPPQDRAMMNQELTVVSFESVLYGRISAATALGRLIHTLMTNPESDHNTAISDSVMAYVNSGWGIHRVLCGIVIQEWLRAYYKTTTTLFLDTFPTWKTLWDSLMAILNDVNAGGSLYFVEIQNGMKTLHGECVFLFNALSRMGCHPPTIPPLVADPSVQSSQLGPIFTLEAAEIFLGQFCPTYMQTAEESVAELYRKALSTQHQVTSIKSVLDPRVYSSLASAVVETGSLPPKLNPIIRNLMASVQQEENSELQKRSASGVAKMLQLNVQLGSRSAVNNKIMKNLCVFLCSDPQKVGVVKDRNDHSGTITYATLKAARVPLKKSGKRGKSITANVDLDGAAMDAIEDAAQTKVNESELQQKRILHRGAEYAIEALCNLFGSTLTQDIPALTEILVTSLNSASPMIIAAKGTLDPLDPITQPLVDSLHVLEIVSKYIDSTLYPLLLDLMPMIRDCLTCNLSIVRNLASACLASIAKYVQVPAMIRIIELVLPLSTHATLDYDRQGCVETAYYIVYQLQESVLPYLIFLMAPLLSRMSDSDEDVRFLSTNAFAQLVKLAPLEAGTPNPDGFTEELIQRKNSERKFIGQLIGSEKVQEFNLPVAINAELRSYQKEGVSWLAFLNRYGLHGILCDGICLNHSL